MTEDSSSVTGIAWQARVPDWIRQTRYAHVVLGGLGVLAGGIGVVGGYSLVLQAGLVLFGLAFLVLAVLELGFPVACHHLGWGKSDRRIGITAGEWRLTTDPREDPPTNQDVWLLRIQGATYLLLSIFTFFVATRGL